jgi:prostaglandin-endoperoxide synthase 2
MFEKLPAWLVRMVVWLADRWSWLGNKINAIIINQSVNSARHRPHPWSTIHDYVSWASLTDLRYSARHLPAFHLTGLPASKDLKALFKRPEGQEQRYCEKSTLLFPAFAQYLTDSFIRTRMPNASANEPESLRRQNTSNHQIDMCPLYGRTEAQILALRLRSEARGERGRLKSQIIAGEEYGEFLFQADGTKKPEFAVLDESLGIDKLKDLPAQRARIFAFGGDRANASPQIAMMNTLFLREHNRLAGELEKRNPEWDDERVFQTARNIIIVIFIKLVVEEYINHIAPSPFRLRADSKIAIKAPWNKPNWITTEFSLLYRWHSLIPDTISWNGKPYRVGATFMNNQLLLDIGLARAFAEVSAQKAAKLGALNTADDLLDIEVLAIEQGRLCDVAPYVDYRGYVKLAPVEKFEDISTDQRVVDLLRTHYKGDVKKVEFYVGLFCEDTVANTPLPSLILKMVALDAFSQALTNPLLSEHVFNPETFSKYGWDTIHTTGCLRDILARNTPAPLGDERISMTRADWAYRW